MRKSVLLVITGVMLGAAAPRSQAILPLPLSQEATISPSPSSSEDAANQSGFTPAPLPDIEATAPVLRTLGPEQAQFTPGIYHPGSTFRGDGYTPGSTIEGNEQKHVGATPEFNMKVPLE